MFWSESAFKQVIFLASARVLILISMCITRTRALSPLHSHKRTRASFQTFHRLRTLTISFYEGDLQAECRQPDDDEERISQKAREDVSFSVDFPSVDLVEQRHLTGGERVTDIVKISH